MQLFQRGSGDTDADFEKASGVTQEIRLFDGLAQTIPNQRARHVFRSMVHSQTAKRVVVLFNMAALILIMYLFVESTVFQSKRVIGYRHLDTAVRSLADDDFFPLVALHCSREEDFTLRPATVGGPLVDPPPGMVAEVMREFYNYANNHHDKRFADVLMAIDIAGAVAAFAAAVSTLLHWLYQVGADVQHHRVGRHTAINHTLSMASHLLIATLFVKVVLTAIEQHSFRNVVGRCKGMSEFLVTQAVVATGFEYHTDMHHAFYEDKIDRQLDTIAWVAFGIYVAMHYAVLSLVKNASIEAALAVAGVMHTTHMITDAEATRIDQMGEGMMDDGKTIATTTMGRTRRPRSAHHRL